MAAAGAGTFRTCPVVADHSHSPLDDALVGAVVHFPIVIETIVLPVPTLLLDNLRLEVVVHPVLHQESWKVVWADPEVPVVLWVDELRVVLALAAAVLSDKQSHSLLDPVSWADPLAEDTWIPVEEPNRHGSKKVAEDGSRTVHVASPYIPNEAPWVDHPVQDHREVADTFPADRLRGNHLEEGVPSGLLLLCDVLRRDQEVVDLKSLSI